MRHALLMMIASAVLLLHPSPAGAGEEGQNNVLIYWSDGKKLKAVTLTCLSNPPGPVGIVSIPRRTVLQPGNPPLTVEDLYYKGGRQALTNRLEKLFGIPIDSYVLIKQETLQHLSDILGPVRFGPYETTLAGVFEGSYTDEKVDLQVEIRGLAGCLLQPSVVLKLPHLLWVYSTQVESNLSAEHALLLFSLIRDWGPDILQKKAVPGKKCIVGNKKYRVPPPGAFRKTLQEVTSPPA